MSLTLSPTRVVSQGDSIWDLLPEEILNWVEQACPFVVNKSLATQRILQGIIHGNIQDCSARTRNSFEVFFNTNNLVSLESVQRSAGDGSLKFLLKARARDPVVTIESVLIPERGRLTLCVSSQGGCAQGCRFCATGRMGLSRSLTQAEILGQLKLVSDFLKSDHDFIEPLVAFSGTSKITNVVFMGMGEPLDNLAAVMGAVKVMIHPWAFGLSPRRVTVSTVGLLPQLKTFLHESKASLALSVHSPFSDERARIVPAEGANPLAESVNVLRSLPRGKRFSVFAQVTLLRGVNDSLAHADALGQLFWGVPVKFNLIPLNESHASAYRRPDLVVVHNFAQQLRRQGYVATVRLSKGRDVAGACGQLAATHGGDAPLF